MTPAEIDLARRIILAREAAGLHTTYDDRLTEAALAHAADMARNPGLRHVGSDGSDGGQRIRRAGYDWVEWGEVIGWGFGGDTAKMVEWWLESPQHRDILLSPVLRDIGAGVTRGNDGEWYYVFDMSSNTALFARADGRTTGEEDKRQRPQHIHGFFTHVPLNRE